MISATVRKRPVTFQLRVHEVTHDAVTRVKVAVLVCNVWHAACQHSWQTCLHNNQCCSDLTMSVAHLSLGWHAHDLSQQLRCKRHERAKEDKEGTSKKQGTLKKRRASKNQKFQKKTKDTPPT